MITPKKRLGQNFLQDPNTVRNIVAALQAPPDAPVIEIGPGLGALTGSLTERYPDLVAVEIDERAVAVLRELYPDVDIRHMDILNVDWEGICREKGAPLYVIGNLPYYITTPILFDLLDAQTVVRRAVIMMQLEVAERLVAEPRTKAYGILSVWTQLFAEPQLCFRVSRNVFYPKPNVTSAVVALDFRKHPALDNGVDIEFLRQVVRTAFNQRRKMLRNSLKAIVEETQRPLPEPRAQQRPEALSPEAFVELARHLMKQS